MSDNKPLRQAMPETAAFIDALRAAFGPDTINDAIRNGMQGGSDFYAIENGHQIGSKLPEADLKPISGHHFCTRHYTEKTEKRKTHG